jgi:hypothetical protein
MPITEEHFETYDWQQVIAESDPAIRTEYKRLFGERAREARESGDEEAEELFSLLQAITFPHFKRDSEDNPFPAVDDIDKGDLEVLTSVFTQIEDAEFRARVGDVLWLRKIGDKPHEYAFASIDAYQEAAVDLEGFRNNQPTIKRLARALQLASQLGQHDQIQRIESLIEDRIREWAPTENTWGTKEYSELLYNFELGEPTEQAELLKQAAQSAMEPEENEESGSSDSPFGSPDEMSLEDGDPWLSKGYWELAAKWHFRRGEDGDAYDALRGVVGCLVTVANSVEQAISRACHLESALAIYHTHGIPNADEEKEELYRAVLEAQNQAVAEFGRVSTNIAADIGSAEVEKVEQLAGLDFPKALTEFALLCFPASKEELEDATRQSASVAPLDMMIAKKQVNAFGRVTGKKPSATEDEAAAFEYEILQSARFDWAFTVVNRIEPARQQLAENHEFTLEAITNFLSDNPIVPSGRLESFAKGLLAGFQGDFLTAAHILTVQFEESVRHLLRQEDVITSGFGVDRTQYERNLNNFLDPSHDTYREPILHLFGEDLAFQLHALLVDKRGANLRNEVAHALLPDQAYFQPPSRYFWWLVWHLIIYGSPHVEEWIDDPMDRDQSDAEI